MTADEVAMAGTRMPERATAMAVKGGFLSVPPAKRACMVTADKSGDGGDSDEDDGDGDGDGQCKFGGELIFFRLVGKPGA